MPKEAIKDGIFRRVVTKPLINPITKATIKPIATDEDKCHPHSLRAEAVTKEHRV